MATAPMPDPGLRHRIRWEGGGPVEKTLAERAAPAADEAPRGVPHWVKRPAAREALPLGPAGDEVAAPALGSFQGLGAEGSPAPALLVRVRPPAPSAQAGAGRVLASSGPASPAALRPLSVARPHGPHAPVRRFPSLAPDIPPPASRRLAPGGEAIQAQQHAQLHHGLAGGSSVQSRLSNPLDSTDSLRFPVTHSPPWRRYTDTLIETHKHTHRHVHRDTHKYMHIHRYLGTLKYTHKQTHMRSHIYSQRHKNTGIQTHS